MTKKELIRLLQDLVVNVEEDCPSQYRTKHLRMCMNEAYGVLQEYFGVK